LETLEQNAHPMEQNIEKGFFIKKVLEFYFEPLAT